MALVLTKLFTGQLLTPSNTAQLLAYMQDTNNEELIPAASGPGISSITNTASLEETSMTQPFWNMAGQRMRW